MTDPLFILGPTGSGKHKVSMSLARRHGGEIISVDSMKVYRGLDIGTAKPSGPELQEVRHHLIDILDPSERFTAGHFVEAAGRAAEQIRGRGGPPILSGGTFLYYKAFAYGLFRGPAPSSELREELLRMGVDALHAELQAVDPEAAGKIHRNDLKRLVRAVEVHRTSGRPISELQKEWSRAPLKRIRAVCLMRPTGELRARIERRIDRMIDAGLVEEARRFLDQPLNPEVERSIGYRECFDHLRGAIDLTETRARMIRRTQRFVRRQLTWIKSLPELSIIELEPGASPEQIADRIPLPPRI